MDKFIHRENVKLYRRLLETITDDEGKRQTILRLLAEEESTTGVDQSVPIATPRGVAREAIESIRGSSDKKEDR